jgi:hypothetical protein
MFQNFPSFQAIFSSENQIKCWRIAGDAKPRIDVIESKESIEQNILPCSWKWAKSCLNQLQNIALIAL